MKNIFETYNFTETQEKSAYDYLIELATPLLKETGGILKMEVEVVDSYLDQQPPQVVVLYTLYVVTTKLGNYRRKILTVVEYSEMGRFPVDIVHHFDDKQDKAVSSENFVAKLEEILSNRIVRNTIENLYKQSKDIGNISLRGNFTDLSTLNDNLSKFAK